MKALERLRALEFGEKVPDHEPTKLTKGCFVGFVSEGAARSADVSGIAAAHFRWLILERDGQRREVCCLPEMAAPELAKCYPGARLIPLPNSAAEAGAIINQRMEVEA